MSMSVSAKIFVGLPREELEKVAPGHCGGIQEFIDKSDLEQCSPYYDGWEHDLIGFTYSSSGSYGQCRFVWDEAIIEALKKDFREIVGLEPDVYLTPYVY
jgi:hypothetical protein